MEKLSLEDRMSFTLEIIIIFYTHEENAADLKKFVFIKELWTNKDVLLRFHQVFMYFFRWIRLIFVN